MFSEKPERTYYDGLFRVWTDNENSRKIITVHCGREIGFANVDNLLEIVTTEFPEVPYDQLIFTFSCMAGEIGPNGEEELIIIIYYGGSSDDLPEPKSRAISNFSAN